MCLNGNCTTLSLELSASDPFSGYVQTPERAEALSWQSPAGSENLSEVYMEWNQPLDGLQGGDVYYGKITSAEGVTLLEFDETASYSESYPNGPECGGLCRYAMLDSGTEPFEITPCPATEDAPCAVVD